MKSDESRFLPITGTFLDEITYDIVPSNWTEEDWDKEFATMKDVGIDTVILIRCGLKERLAYPSEVISKHVKTLPVYFDYVKLFLSLSGKYGLKFFFGLYDSGWYWLRHDWKKEVEINLEVVKEFLDNYGDSPAFAGWYLPHETHNTSLRIIDINLALAEAAKKERDLPVLMSPYYGGKKFLGESRGYSLEEHIRQWDEIFSRLKGLVDYVAFQDGTVDFLELEDFTRETAKVARSHGIEFWANVETFSRDMPVKFPPIDFRKLLYKIEVASRYASKLITFEFSHFLSPNSIFPSAKNLFKHYERYILGR